MILINTGYSKEILNKRKKFLDDILNNVIIPKNKFKDKKNILLLILLGIILLLILLFAIYKIWIEDKPDKQKKLELIKDFIKNDINNIDFFISNDGDIFFKIKNDENFLNYLNKNFFKFDVINSFQFKSIFDKKQTISLFDEFDYFKNEINNLKKINQKKTIIIGSDYKIINDNLSKLDSLEKKEMTNQIYINIYMLIIYKIYFYLYQIIYQII